MFNRCFELHLYWSVKSLPEDLVCQRDLLHPVFPERWRERKSLSPETPFYIFAPFVHTNEEVFLFLPQDRLVQLCLSLPASPLVPETKHKQAQNLSGRVCMKSSIGAFTVCVTYQWTWRTHSTRSTRFTLKNTKRRMWCGFKMCSSNDESKRQSSPLRIIISDDRFVPWFRPLQIHLLAQEDQHVPVGD